MPDNQRTDAQDFQSILERTGLCVHRRPEWCDVPFGGNFRADFTVVGDSILISRPSGYATIDEANHSFHLGYLATRQCIPEHNPYVIIEDYARLTGVSHEARKFFINDLKHRRHVAAIIFCNTSPLFNLSISLGKRIYLPQANVHLAKTLEDAIAQARKILAANGLPPAEEALPVRRQKYFSDISSEKQWTLNLNEYTLRFEIIGNDILHPVPSGYLKKTHIDPIFKFQKKVFDDAAFEKGKYYILSDLGALKSATFEARRLFVKAMKEWHDRYPFQMVVFYNTNWILRAAINIAKTTAPFSVHIAEDFQAALKIVEKEKEHPHGPETSAVTANTSGRDPEKKHIDDLINILSGINWKTSGPEEIIRRLDPAHPFYEVAEAVSLIKMDMDQVLSDHQKTEKKLIESREKYKNILNSIEEGYYEVDTAGNLTFFNDSLCRILGYTRTQLQGMNYRSLSDADYAKTIYRTFNQTFRTGSPAKAFNWKLTRRDGSARFVETSISCICDEHGKPSGFRGIVRDITQRMLAEKEKEKLEARLRHAQKMEAIGTLAGGVAHDLNNILSGIVSYPDLLMMELPPESPLRHPIQTIRKSGEKAAAIVQDLLTLARKGLPDQSVVNLNSLITEYLRSPEYQALLSHHPDVRVNVRSDERLMNMSASGVHISKIIMNLITNAAEAMPDGGTITISTGNMYVDSPLSGYSDIKEGEYVRLQVTDCGTGMLPEDKERIFEPFYTKKAMGKSGSGLGMAMVWGAVHDHNGYIEINSTPGRGTAISIYFPAVRTTVAADRAPVSLELFAGKKEKILIVDDMPEQRELAGLMLTQLNYITASVPSGEEAVEHIKQYPADLLIIDMIMPPGMDGLDTYKEIIALNPGQKAIIVTGYSTSDRIREAQSLGAGACVKKPYLIESLAQAVREALDK